MVMVAGIWVLGDQLWNKQAALDLGNVAENPVILVESRNYARQCPYHRQKLVLVWSAMRHFASELKDQGWSVTYAMADHFHEPLQIWVDQNQLSEVWIMKPNDRPFTQLIETIEISCPIKFIPNNHFLWSEEEFLAWAGDRKRFTLEDFYRTARKRDRVLIKGDKPEGGKWNFDHDNRKPPKQGLDTPPVQWFEPDTITLDVIHSIQELNLTGYGAIEPFRWGVTRNQALQVLALFVEKRLDTFGPYQDAMVTGEETLWHSLISPYLNLGLLHPKEVIEHVEERYHDHALPINSVEGFIRQVLGWREYLRGIYIQQQEDYKDQNWFGHQHPLPAFFWDSQQTDMNCLQQVLGQVERTGYAHHIQRLMILSNFALISGISPQVIEQWFHAVLIDAHDWVMQTNVIGMGQFADGGVLASKPYAASANYIHKMSDYCRSCRYNWRDRTGKDACPFNFFYWDFLIRHFDKLKSQGRMHLILSHVQNLSDAEQEKIQDHAVTWWNAQLD